ncbi:hypothetical protein HEP87_59185 [Streptomyces sp. S1D4-11]|nr:hypothetical protein [Streptomyces sp. S1D4-11]
MRIRRIALQREAADYLPTWRGCAERRTATAVKGSPNQTDPAAFAARGIVARAHARGIRVVGGTITPYGGDGGWAAAREAVRQSVNDLTWYGGVFDAVVDFDAAVRDSDVPDRTRLEPSTPATTCTSTTPDSRRWPTRSASTPSPERTRDEQEIPLTSRGRPAGRRRRARPAARPARRSGDSSSGGRRPDRRLDADLVHEH